jgi:hypothetical protein
MTPLMRSLFSSSSLSYVSYLHQLGEIPNFVLQTLVLFAWLISHQPPASSTFLSEQTSHQQPASSTLLSEQTSTSHQPPANRTGCLGCPHINFVTTVIKPTPADAPPRASRLLHPPSHSILRVQRTWKKQLQLSSHPPLDE